MNQQPSYEFLTPPQAAGELGWLGVYRVLRVLGTGSTSVVFEAADPEVARSVAVKVLRQDRAHFLRGAEAMAGLAHEHIVAIHEVGEFRGVPYMVLPHLRGETWKTGCGPRRRCRCSMGCASAVRSPRDWRSSLRKASCT